jgi:23S rRNA (adenine1618-N6)-methyltransferase
MKTKLHPRNFHNDLYDFQQLIHAYPALKSFVSRNVYGNETIDFSNPSAVLALNKALLLHYYGIVYWELPENYLCPPIPGRADYIHYAADLLATRNQGRIPEGAAVKVLDIGTGANCIYPIIGSKVYGWRFVGTDVDRIAMKGAEKIVAANDFLKDHVELRFQKHATSLFKNILEADEHFDLVVCNPPFHSSAEAAKAGSLRKLKNLGSNSTGDLNLNFGGQSNELFCEGGEVGFIQRMVHESMTFQKTVLWFTSLVSKSTSLPPVLAALKRAGVCEFKKIDMAQGQKSSRLIAWTFQDTEMQEHWCKRRFNQV